MIPIETGIVKLGISPIGWTNDDMPELGGNISFDQCLEEISKAGFRGTEVGSKFPESVDVLNKKLELHGVQIAGQWFSSFLIGERKVECMTSFQDRIEFLGAVCADVIVVSEQSGSIQGLMHEPIFTSKPRLSANEWRTLARGLEEMGKIARDAGIRLVYHHHMGTVVQNREEINTLMELTDP
ncbi:MAG: myo-inosose-2 dehydratase, partial [Promethearchaeota archaeon]